MLFAEFFAHNLDVSSPSHAEAVLRFEKLCSAEVPFAQILPLRLCLQQIGSELRAMDQRAVDLCLAAVCRLLLPPTAASRSAYTGFHFYTGF